MSPILKLSLAELQKFYVDVIPHHAQLGMRVVERVKSRVVIDLPFASRLACSASDDSIHQGAINTLIDTTCGSVIPTLQDSFRRAATLDLRTDFLVPARPRFGARCQAECFHFDSNLAFVRATVYESGTGLLIAKASGTFAAFNGKPDDNLIGEALSTVLEPVPANSTDADSTSYEHMMGIDFSGYSNELIGHMAFRDHLVGNTKLGVLHGGAVASLIQVTAAKQLQLHIQGRPIRLFNFNVEFIAAAKCSDTWARATVLSSSKRFASVRVTAFQTNDEPIAAATAQFSLV